MSFRQRISERFDTLKEGANPLQESVLFDRVAWQSEISTFDKTKDKNYRPAFVMEMVEKYGWSKDQIIQAYSDLVKSPLPVELSNESLANLFLESALNPWKIELVAKAYINGVNFDVKSLTPQASMLLKIGDFDGLKDLLCGEIKKNKDFLGGAVAGRYMMAKAAEVVKERRFVSGKGSDVVEAGDKVEKPEGENQLVELLDLSNPVPMPYSNIGGSPADQSMFLAPGRPMSEQPTMNDPFRRPDPSSLKMQYM